MTKRPAYKRGDKVNVFFDPFTETRFDGEATVKKIISAEYEPGIGWLHRMEVSYPSDPGQTFERVVLWHSRD